MVWIDSAVRSANAHRPLQQLYSSGVAGIDYRVVRILFETSVELVTTSSRTVKPIGNTTSSGFVELERRIDHIYNNRIVDTITVTRRI